MEVLHSRCAGLDVHKDSVVACVRQMKDGTVKTTVKSFKTTTRELIAAGGPVMTTTSGVPRS